MERAAEGMGIAHAEMAKVATASATQPILIVILKGACTVRCNLQTVLLAVWSLF
jgi:hypothetical protein